MSHYFDHILSVRKEILDVCGGVGCRGCEFWWAEDLWEPSRRLSAKASGPSSVQSVQPVGPGTPVVLISLWL